MTLSEWTPAIGGVGGAYFLASSGDLTIEIEKCDRNQRRHITELRAILFGPDRQVIQDITIPDDGLTSDGGMGPTQTATLFTQVQHPGIYGMMVMVSNDRYGEDILWRFRTNCSKYLIETSRGHKDARHEEPIVLLDPDRAGDVCFLPRSGQFEIHLSDLPNTISAVALFDANNQIVATLPVADGKTSYTVAPNASRGEHPYRLHFPKAQATVVIDGVTRWDDTDVYPDLSLWSPSVDAYFPLPQTRWLITPYQQTIYGALNEEKTVLLNIHNNDAKETTVDLSLTFPEQSWQAHLSTGQITVKSKETVPVELTFTVPSNAAIVHVHAQSGNHPVTTYATLKVHPGKTPTHIPLNLPLVLKPFLHENEQFGYKPDYPVENQVYFDPQNRPYIRASEGVMTYRKTWQTIGAAQSVSSAHAGPWTKVAFDADGDIYVLAMNQGVPTLFHSSDDGQTFKGYPLPTSESRSFDIEQFSGHNIPSGPPPITRYIHTQSDPKLFWRRYGDLELLLPKKTANGIEWEAPIYLSDKSLGVSSHSGIPSSIVSRGSKVHVAWGEATEPDANAPGVPAFVVTYDRDTRQLGKPVLIGYGAPANDVHNTPCITMDSHGYLHVLTGTHGSPFHYARSLKPNDAAGGWTDPEPVGENLRQTYIGLVCGPDNTLHLAFRLWRHNEDPFPNGYHATLSYMQKLEGKSWSDPCILIRAPFTEYSIWYHRLTLDRTGRLFLSYDYWSTFWYYRTDHPGRRRALLMSPDGGNTWKLAEKGDLIP